jgi:caa(3)-type oxidase subunit IV
MTQAAPVATDRAERAARTLNIAVWAGMLGIVAVEVAVTYARPGVGVLIASLLVLAVAEATLGVLYFMHLRHERAILGWSLMSALVFVLLMMNQLWPDALRVFRLRLRE